MIVFQVYITYWLLSVLAGFIVAALDPPWADAFCRYAFGGPLLSLFTLFVVGILACIWQR